METLEVKLCAWKTIAHSQREDEKAFVPDNQGTKSFELTGCYECEGYNPQCGCYMPERE